MRKQRERHYKTKYCLHEIFSFSFNDLLQFFLISLCIVIYRMSKSQPGDKPLLQDSEYNLIKQLEKEADFLYSAVEDYIRDAEKDNKPELVKLWNTIKEDEQNHLKMLRNELIKEIKQNEFK
jgi:hypothetical protein